MLLRLRKKIVSTCAELFRVLFPSPKSDEVNAHTKLKHHHLVFSGILLEQGGLLQSCEREGN